MGVTKLPLNELESDTPKEIELRLLPKYDMLKVKDKKDRGTITIKVHNKIIVFVMKFRFNYPFLVLCLLGQSLI